jgi:cytochrome c peroxidase
LFTDFSYDVLAVPRNRATPFNSEPRHYDLGLCMQPGITLRVPKGVDLSELCGAFKVPTLRNVAVTGPYFHNGAISTLRDAVAFYATRDVDPARWYKDGVTFDDLPERYWKNVNRTEVPYDIKPGQQPRLNDHEIDAIVAFLETLTDPQGD